MNSWINIFSGLRAAIANKAAPPREAVNALLCLVWARIGRIQQRLERLIAHWRAGTLPKQFPSRAGQTRPHTTSPKYPTSDGWLGAHGYDIRGYASQLSHAFASDAEFADFLKAVPRAGRILRPLCHMLGIEQPAPIRVEPKPRKPRAPRPPKPKPEPFRFPLPKGLGLTRRRRFFGV